VPTAFGVIITVSAAFPAIGVVLLAPLLLLNQTQSSLSNASISIEDRQSPGVVRHGEIDIQIPLIMKVSRDERVHVRFNTGSEQIREPSWVPKAKLEGNTFTIKPVNFEGVSTKSNYDWDWNVTPTKPGDRLLTFLVEPSVQLTLKGDIKDFSIDNGKLFAKIDVRDEIGLKPWQRGTAIAIGGVLTLIGTIAGYSFLKRYLERPVPTLASQPSLPPASSQAGLPPVPKISSKTRPSQRNHRSKGK
jgi:hypothetical protein